MRVLRNTNQTLRTELNDTRAMLEKVEHQLRKARIERDGALADVNAVEETYACLEKSMASFKERMVLDGSTYWELILHAAEGLDMVALFDCASA